MNAYELKMALALAVAAWETGRTKAPRTELATLTEDEVKASMANVKPVAEVGSMIAEIATLSVVVPLGSAPK
jgi:hypothetical protein